MAEQQSSTAIVPVAGEYLIKVKEFDAAGKGNELSVAMPNSVDFRQWSVMQQALMLKKGSWQGSAIPEIVYAIAYANNLGLDILQGDVYSTGSGRIATSNKAKIKLALKTGNIEGIEAVIRETDKPIALKDCSLKNDLECTVTVHVKGWKTPIVRKALLSQWFNARNPNWASRPHHMLELNTVAHAVEYVNPTETGDDEAPPIS